VNKRLNLFLTMLKIGLFTFGGGYAMIALLENEFVSNKKWIDKDEFLDMVAIAESTPGPIAVNMATFVGSAQGGALGALAATLGVVLPSFVIILIIAAVLRNLLRYPAVKAVLAGIRPAVVGLILATALTLLTSELLSLDIEAKQIHPDVRGEIIFAVLIGSMLGSKRLLKKKLSPILMILLSAGLGMLLYSV
jgi:chromate transporter